MNASAWHGDANFLDKTKRMGYCVPVSSLKFGGVTFRIYPQDHKPRHVHGEYANTEVVVALQADHTVVLADRPDRVKPRNAKVSHIKKILATAAEHFDELVSEWEKNH